uniref:Uncharacterized protein n=1 Tax=Oryza sativa subsp. japonica TaxID=39947 RepID=Q6YTL7_ORYSJ|nr:hypothetical protein [Oryza sativa Japonica Group]BAD30136.1 hypothetical protein [Oryza sativa Japonica Group]
MAAAAAARGDSRGGHRHAPASSTLWRWRAWDPAGGGRPCTDPAAAAINAKIQRWRSSTHGSSGRPPSPRMASISPPLLFLPSLDPAEGRGVGGGAAGGEHGSEASGAEAATDDDDDDEEAAAASKSGGATTRF